MRKFFCHTYKVADDIYQQLAGGSIGLELTGAVSRPFMLRWDYLYKTNARKAGMEIKMYERYVDDSNQVVIVPPPGAKYESDKKKVTARIMTDITNSVMPCVTMEYDVPSRN